MNTKLIMTIGAVVLGGGGNISDFCIRRDFTLFEFDRVSPLILPILGALYFGFAMLNWPAKANLLVAYIADPLQLVILLIFLLEHLL